MHILISTLLCWPAANAAASREGVVARVTRGVHSDLRSCQANLVAQPLDASEITNRDDVLRRAAADGTRTIAGPHSAPGPVSILAEPHKLSADGPTGVRFTLAKIVGRADLTRFESHLFRNQLQSIIETSLIAADLSTFDDPRVNVVPSVVVGDEDHAVIAATFWLDAAELPRSTLERLIGHLRDGERRTTALLDAERTTEELRRQRSTARNRVGELLDGLPAFSDSAPTLIDEPELTSWGDLLNRKKSRGTQIVGGSADRPTHVLTLAEPRRLTGDHPDVGIRLTLGRTIPGESVGRFTVDLVRNQILVVLERALHAVGLQPFDDERVLVGYAAAVTTPESVLLSVPVWLDTARIPREVVEDLVLRLHEHESELTQTLNH